MKAEIQAEDPGEEEEGPIVFDPPPSPLERSYSDVLRALLCLLIFGCFFSFLHIYSQHGYTTESLEDFDCLPPPLGAQWRARLLASSYVTHGWLYLGGLITLGGAFLPLVSPQLCQKARWILLAALSWKVFLLSADVRLWSTNELIHVLACLVFLWDPWQSRGRIRLCLAIPLMASAATDAWHQGPSLVALLQFTAPLLWLWGKEYRHLGAALLVALLVWYGLIDVSYRTVILIPLVLLSYQRQPPPGFPNRLLLIGLSLLGALMLPHGLAILSPPRIPVSVIIQFRKGPTSHDIRIRYPRFTEGQTNDYRVDIFKVAQLQGKQQYLPVLEPVSDGKTILLNLNLFNQRPECLREPYLYQFYLEELMWRWAPDFVYIRATWGDQIIYEQRRRGLSQGV